MLVQKAVNIVGQSVEIQVCHQLYFASPCTCCIIHTLTIEDSRLAFSLHLHL